MKYDITLIHKAVAEAITAARPLANTPDGGSCNFDAAYISVPGMREATAQKIGGVHMVNSRMLGRMLRLGGTIGQAGCRTAMAEAQYEFLKKNYPQLCVGIWYQVD